MSGQPTKAQPCIHCGDPTKARHGMCWNCSMLANESRGDHLCAECGVALTSHELCSGCVLAIKDDTGVRGLGESPYDLEASGGQWVSVGGVMVWQREWVAA
jgi:predicted amidophosphoribosyltransferase